MNVKQAKRAIRLREWAKMVRDRQGSGMTVKTWCERSGIQEARYYYGLCQVRRAVVEGFNPDQPIPEEPARLVKVDFADAPAERSVSHLPARIGNPPETEPRTSGEQQAVLSANHIRLHYGGGILDIPTGTNAEAIAEVLKAILNHAV